MNSTFIKNQKKFAQLNDSTKNSLIESPLFCFISIIDSNSEAKTSEFQDNRRDLDLVLHGQYVFSSFKSSTT